MPIDDEPPSGAHADSIGRQAPPDAKRPAGFVASAIHAARLGVMAGGVSLVLVGLICAFWVLVGEFSLSDGVAFTMFFTAVIAVLVFVGASIVAVWESAPVRRLRGRRREQHLARRRRAGRFGTDVGADLRLVYRLREVNKAAAGAAPTPSA
jgi:membrane protein implicated in regulation of membrane protease activity